MKREKDKVAIVGTASTSANAAPFGDPEWDVWGLNEHRILDEPRHTHWFNLHKPHILTDENAAMLAACKKPVILHTPDERVPGSYGFPFDKLRERFGDYWTSTVAWQIGMAMVMEYKTIGVWGVDMDLDSEYHYQRPCCEHYLGIADGLGIEVVIPEASRLLKSPWIYGLEDPPSETPGVLPLAFFREHMASCVKQTKAADANLEKAKLDRAQLEGAGSLLSFILENAERANRHLGIPKAKEGKGDE